MMRLYWVGQDDAAHRESFFDESILDDARAIWEFEEPIVMSMWPIGQCEPNELPPKWDWPGGRDDP